MKTMGIGLRKILELECFQDTKVVAGEGAIASKTVQGITIIEAPDIADWIKGGEVLLTSLYSIQEDEEKQKEMTIKLAQKNASALLIKVSRFIQEVPRGILEIGEQWGLPIIQIPGAIKYVDIMYPVMSELFNKQVTYLEHYRKCHERFIELALRNRDLKDIAKELKDIVHQPVIIYGRDLETLAYTDADFQRIISLKDRPKPLTRNSKWNFYRQEAGFESNDTTTRSLVITPVMMLEQVKAYLAVVERDRPLNELDCIAMETAGTNASLEQIKELAVAEVEYKFKNEIIEDIITDRYKTEEDMYQRGKSVGWNLKKAYSMIVVQLNNYNDYFVKKKAMSTLGEITGRIQRIIDQTAVHYTKAHIVINKSSNFLILYPMEKKVESGIKKFAKELQENVKHEIPLSSITIGIGGIASQLREIRRSYQEATDAVSFGQMVYGDECVVKYDELGVYKLLCKYQDIDTLREFVHPALLKLYQYNADKNNELIETLEIYLAYNGNAKITAEKLFIHYKTVLYRINRIKEIMEIDFEDKERKLEIEVGVKIIRLLQKRGIDIVKAY